MKKMVLTAVFGAVTFIVNAQYQTPTVDGSIGGSEYANSYNVGGSNNYYITWNATNLYVAVNFGNATNDAINLYIDYNPGPVVNVGGNVTGNLTGTSYDQTTPNIPFNADFRAFVKSGYDDYVTANGSGGWNSAISNSITKSISGSVVEFSIPWSAITGNIIPPRFNFLLYRSYDNNGNTGTYSAAPLLNPTLANCTSSCARTVTQPYYFTVSSTANGSSTAAFSRISYATNSGSASLSTATNYYDFTLNSSSATLTSGTHNISGTLLVAAGGTLNTGGLLTLKSTASNTARLANVSGTISGNITCEAYFAGGASQASGATPGVRGFRFLSHPFNSNPTLNTLITAGLSITGGGGSTNGFTTSNTNNPSAFSYDPTVTNAGSESNVGTGASAASDPGWIAYTNATQTWNKLQGIRVLFRGTGTQGLNGVASYTVNPLTLSMTGAVNTGNQTFTLPATTDADNRWSLVGNPYPSQINIGGLLNIKYNGGAGNIGAAAYVFNPSLAGTNRGGFDMIDISSGGNYILPMYGAVFVQNTVATSHTISFVESNKTSLTSNLSFRTSSANNALVLKMEDGNGNVLDQTFLRFNNKATNNFESLDGGKMLNEYSIYTVSDDMKMLAIDSRKEPAVGSSIALGVQSSVARAFVLKAEEINMPVGTTAYLKDKFLNTEEPISAGFSYAFSTTSNAASSGAGRFEIVFKKQAQPITITTALEVNLSPNPVTDVLNINYSNPDQTNASIRLVNTNGQAVRTINLGTANTGKQQVSVRGIAAGNYTVELNTGKQKITKQVTKL